jgi:hypothetical protein
MSAKIRWTTGSTLRRRPRAHLVCFPQKNKLRKRRHVGSGCAIARYFAAARHHFRLYSVLRRGGGGGATVGPCHGVRHHDRRRPYRQRVRHRLPLLADVHACRVRVTFLRWYHGGSGRLPQRRRRRRRPCCGFRRRSRDARRRAIRLCGSEIASAPWSDRLFIRGARRHRRLSRNAGACPNRRPLDVPSTAWREAFAIAGAMFVGGTALVRMSAMATSPFTKQARAVAPAQPRIMTATNQR